MSSIARMPLKICGHPTGAVDVGDDGSITISISGTDIGRELFNAAASGHLNGMQLMPLVEPARPA